MPTRVSRGAKAKDNAVPKAEAKAEHPARGVPKANVLAKVVKAARAASAERIGRAVASDRDRVRCPGPTQTWDTNSL